MMIYNVSHLWRLLFLERDMLYYANPIVSKPTWSEALQPALNAALNTRPDPTIIIHPSRPPHRQTETGHSQSPLHDPAQPGIPSSDFPVSQPAS
jgi:hypothetical protein